jgi:hypothetical protein
MSTSGSLSGGVWGSLVNAANKVTDTISSLTTQSNPGMSQINRSVSAMPIEETNKNTLNRPRSQTMPSPSTMPAAFEGDLEEAPKQMAIDTLGEGELSLRELGFESDTPNLPRSSGESSMRSSSVQDEIRDGGHENDFSVQPLKTGIVDSNGHIDHQRTESVGRSRRSLTVPSRGAGADLLNEGDRRLTSNGMQKPRRLSSLSKKGSIRRNESVASRASSDAPVADDVTRRTRKRSSLVTTDGVIDSPRSKAAGTPEASEDRENEDGLYIHGKDGKKRRVPITGFAVQSGKRNRDFHALFKSVEESDYLIEGTA